MMHELKQLHKQPVLLYLNYDGLVLTFVYRFLNKHPQQFSFYAFKAPN